MAIYFEVNNLPPYLSYTTCMFSWRFRKYDPNAFSDSPFENLLKVFKELLMFTSGNVGEALNWPRLTIPTTATPRPANCSTAALRPHVSAIPKAMCVCQTPPATTRYDCASLALRMW